MENNLVKVKNGQIKLAKNVMKAMYNFQVAKAKYDLIEKEVKEALLNAMEENGIKTFENDFVRVTYKAKQIRKTVDTQALMDDGLYYNYLKESIVKPSIVMTWK